MGPKRASDSLSDDPANKLPKLEQSIAPTPRPQPRTATTPTDFSAPVKKKSGQSSRTGQACDRCKNRKIRCDGNLEGCSPCAQVNQPCVTTDRITGRPLKRRHAEDLESENYSLRRQVEVLQAQLHELGAEPRVLVPGFNNAPSQQISWDTQGHQTPAQGYGGSQSVRSGSIASIPGYGVAGSMSNGTETLPLHTYKSGGLGENHLGVSVSQPPLSHPKGTKLSVFGHDIDITDFVYGQEDYDKSVMSYSHFLDVLFNGDKQTEYMPFPEAGQLENYAQLYLRSLNPYTMLLDKPTFTKLIHRISHEPTFIPTPAETVQVHMMLAILKYQSSTRNLGDAVMMEESHKHYRYSLTFVKDLWQHHSLEDIGALALIGVHLRNFPKPDAAWMMCNTTFLLAIEHGLHRSVSTPTGSENGTKVVGLEVELRKRVFWTLHTLASNLSGKLGRPMPIDLSDVDVEFPTPVDDSLHGESLATPFHGCSFRVGIEASKFAAISSKLHNTIYAVKQSAHTYELNVRQLENEVEEWKRQLPNELAQGSTANTEIRIFALYLEFWEQEFQLLLHHPALFRSNNTNLYESNMDKCVEASSKMIRICTELRNYKCLDVPWINSVVYIAAIFTTLFIQHTRRDKLTPACVKKLISEMIEWLEVMRVCGQLLGTGEALMIEIQKIIFRSVSTINEHVSKKNTEAVARAALGAPDHSHAAATYGSTTNYHAPYLDTHAATTPVSHGGYTPVPTTVQTTPSYNYTPTFETASVPATDEYGMSAAQVNALANANAASATAPALPPTVPVLNRDIFGPATIAAPGYQQPNITPPQHEWQRWIQTVSNSSPVGTGGAGDFNQPQEFMNTANTLMALGGRDATATGLETGAEGRGVVNGGGQTAMPVWPLNVFHIGPSGHGRQ